MATRRRLPAALRHDGAATLTVGVALLLVTVVAWGALLALVIFAEKQLPASRWTVRLVGGVLVGLGIMVALRPEGAMLLRGGGMGM